MKRKRDTKDTAIRSEEITQEGVTYTYELLKRESRETVSYGIPLYSISVKMTDQEGSETSATSKEVFADAGKAIDFFEKLVKNFATPIDLPYIIEDEVMR